MNPRLKGLFDDLGKPTLRGVRKCPKCGTYNGTRGLSCKNKSCDVVFKETSDRRKNSSSDAVKIITGSTAQVYSVRIRDRGPEYRGFVQLPILQELDSLQDQSMEASLITQPPPRCFVETCHKSDININPCQHIKASVNCDLEAQPLSLKNCVLNSLPISSETKQAIWLLATETTGPLVQRVSKHVMVVKCKPNIKHPLGFLHFSFLEVTRKRVNPEYRFQCTCRAFKNFKLSLAKDEVQKRCVHFYACICAFASDEKLSKEFAFFINLESNIAPENKLIAIFNDTQDQCKVDIEVLPDAETLLTVATEAVTSGIEVKPAKKQKKDDNKNEIETPNIIAITETITTNGNKTRPLIKKSSVVQPKKTGIVTVVDESTVSIKFVQWLASVTERINQTMHYQFDGHPEPLVFHVPQVFFDCLQQRIATGVKKKRLPNSTTAFVRKDALPLGTFSKYSWHITNILHVKQIFDTPEMPLDITRSFIENRDGTYDLYQPPKDKVDELAENYKKTEKTLLIKPSELKTYLKVGTMSTDQKEPTPFIIEWIPDILPKSQIGELRITFEYGHQRNGHMEQRTIPQHIIQIQQV
ncbi:uncharacterized protein C2orf42 homolog [Centruroides sculpturatus]|uniref:uncharacterized protein C2orf42 homolog n=1 Tax=Centruroides sculpturatus TaxID=218467 RepID=UPI000C6E9F6C|nr:uncharacterized protein C2orf42 homolog [Centruroides sculpturatus]XP_023213643.1 uncharacterized protein C2orf42 homolog [Centruroides sculpturatus]